MARKRRYLDEVKVPEEANQVIKDKFTVNGVTYGTIPSHYTKGKIANSKTKSDITSDRVYVRQGDNGKWYQTRMDKDANNINYYLDNKALIDRSNEIIESQSKQGIGHKIEVDKADARARQQWFSNEDATKFLLTTAGLGALGGGLISAPLATTLGLAGGYGGGKLVDKGMQLGTGKTWGQWASDKTGLPEWLADFTNPGAFVGGGLGATMAKPALATYNNYRLAKVVNDEIQNAIITPSISKNSKFVRTKIGDVIVDDPNMMYHVDNGNNNGVFGTGAYIRSGKLYPGQPKRLGDKAYVWWNKGKPYTKMNNSIRLITSPNNNNFIHVRSQNYPIGQWNGKRGFVTNSEYVTANPINTDNINIYNYKPGYGYKKVNNSNIANYNVFMTDAADQYPYIIPNYTDNIEGLGSIANYKGDHLALTKQRLIRNNNEGYAHLENLRNAVEESHKYDPEWQASGEDYRIFPYDDYNIYRLNNMRASIIDDSTKPDAFYDHNTRRFYRQLNPKNKGDFDTPQKINIIDSHEFAHAVNPVPAYPVDRSAFRTAPYAYLGHDNNMELAARGTQLKNYFGLGLRNDPYERFTTDMLKYAAKHYVKDTGIDNNMSKMFFSINDWDKVANWINNNAPAILPISLGLGYSKMNKSNKTKTKRINYGTK